MPCAWRNVSLLLATLTVLGCTTPIQKGKSPLMPPRMSANTVVLDVFCVRFPFGDPEANETLWEEIDEQQFPTDVRERWNRNGFRVGIVTGQLPVALSNLLELADKPAPNGDRESTIVQNVNAQPRVVVRHIQLPPRRRCEINASGIIDQASLLLWDNGMVSGQIYDQAQGLFAAQAVPQPDGRVRLELMPELHHDQARPNWIADRGMIRLDSSRPKRVFDNMTVSADLAAGASVVITCLPDKPGSLGYHFLTDKNNGLEQRLIMVRLSQTQHNGLFDATEPLTLEP